MTEHKKIKEICDIKKGKKVKITKTPSKSSIPYLLIDTLRGMPPECFTDDSNYLEAEERDVLLVWDGANSGLVGTGLKGAVGSTIGRLRPKEGLASKYLGYFLEFNFINLNTETTGSAIPHVKKENLINLDIRYPLLSEQELIVEAIETQFTRVESVIKTLILLKGKISLYRMSVLKAAFVNRVFSKDNIWEDYEIKDIAKDVQYGLTSKSGSDCSGPRYLRITDIQDRKVDWDKVPFAKDTEDLDKYYLNEGDLVFARTGATVGKSYLIKEHPKNAVFASYLIRIVPDTSKVFPELLWYYFQSPMYWHDISSKQRGIGQPNVNGTVLSKLELSIPKDVEEQKILSADIDAKFSVLDRIEESIGNMLIKAGNLRRSILKSAFEGKLVKEGV